MDTTNKSKNGTSTMYARERIITQKRWKEAKLILIPKPGHDHTRGMVSLQMVRFHKCQTKNVMFLKLYKQYVCYLCMLPG